MRGAHTFRPQQAPRRVVMSKWKLSPRAYLAGCWAHHWSLSMRNVILTGFGEWAEEAFPQAGTPGHAELCLAGSCSDFSNKGVCPLSLGGSGGLAPWSKETLPPGVCPRCYMEVRGTGRGILPRGLVAGPPWQRGKDKGPPWCTNPGRSL